MPPEWTDANKASRVVEFLDGVLGVNEDGDVTLDLGTDFDAGVATLTGLAKLSDEIPERDRRSIVRRSLIEAQRDGNMTPDRVLNEIQQRQGDFLRKPKRPFVLLTSLSIKYFDGLATVRPYGATITFTRNPPDRFERPDVAKRALRRDQFTIPQRFTTVRVHVHARNESDAFEAALNRLDFVRGLWNLALTYGRYRVSFGMGDKPVNPILKGPIHTLHEPDGSPVGDQAWYHPTYPRNLTANDIQSKYDRVKDFEQWCRERLSKATFEDALRDLLIRYASALDDTDLQGAFLKLWAILEDLTNASGETVVKRTLMMFKEPDYRRLVLNQLRSERNRMVHEGHETDKAENLVYELKKYVDVVLEYLLTNVREWNSLSDYGLFLALPKDVDELRKRRRYHDLAYDLLGGR